MSKVLSKHHCFSRLWAGLVYLILALMMTSFSGQIAYARDGAAMAAQTEGSAMIGGKPVAGTGVNGSKAGKKAGSVAVKSRSASRTHLSDGTSYGAPPSICQLSPDDWLAWKSRFLSETGRVVDTSNKSVSHTEGQGYGLLLAQAAGDAKAFDLIWNWTRINLPLRADGLRSWKWDPSFPENPVQDLNAATDGDLLIAWALIRAEGSWGRGQYRDEAAQIARAIRAAALVRRFGYTLLLPGPEGFIKPDGSVVVNLSYWIFPAISAVSLIDPSPDWQELQASGRQLLAKARFGAWNLPPDWLEVSSGTLAPAAGFPAEFGWNALRIPLHLAWSGEKDAGLYAPFTKFWTEARPDGLPAPTVNLTNGSIPTYPASPGIRSIVDLTRRSLGDMAIVPQSAVLDEYYQASLSLLSIVACGSETMR